MKYYFHFTIDVNFIQHVELQNHQNSGGKPMMHLGSVWKRTVWST